MKKIIFGLSVVSLFTIVNISLGQGNRPLMKQALFSSAGELPVKLISDDESTTDSDQGQSSNDSSGDEDTNQDQNTDANPSDQDSEQSKQDADSDASDSNSDHGDE